MAVARLASWVALATALMLAASNPCVRTPELDPPAPKSSTVAPPAKTTTTLATSSTAPAPASTASTAPKAVPTADVSPRRAGDTTPRKFSWTDHPLLQAGAKDVTPAIVAWYELRNDRDDWDISVSGLYTARCSKYTLKNDKYEGTKSKSQLQGYDLLRTPHTSQSRARFVEFETTRASKMCLILHIDDPTYKGDRNSILKVPGYGESLGVAHWDDGVPIPEAHKYGSPSGYSFPAAAIVCRPLRVGVHRLPTPDLLRAPYRIRGYNVLFGESDGSAPAPINPGSSYSGPAIEQQKLCPDALHNLWVVESHDASDPAIASRKWQTWHPQRDPLFNCYYGHEHGSPGMLAGYTERFHYTALKNNNQDESHIGFKGYVVPRGKHWLYVNIHADLTDIGRANTQFHTMVLAVTDRTSGELLYEMSCKADFGGSLQEYDTGRAPPGEDVFILGNAETRKLVTDMYKNRRGDRKVRKKRINMIRPGNLVPGLRYKTPVEVGIYEKWTGGGDQYCAAFGRPDLDDGISVDFRNSITACRNRECTEPYYLNLPAFVQSNKISMPNLGTNRELIFREMTIGKDKCNFTMPAVDESGVFYTDQYCKQVFDGPGPNRIRQVFKPKFTGLTIDGSFGLSDAHGHYPYKIRSERGLKDFPNFIGGLRGVVQDQGALGFSAHDPSPRA